MLRKIVQINEEKCDGCGLCIGACHEAALQLVNGKAKLVSDNLCDGLGACLPDCPRGAINIIEREAVAFDEAAVERHTAGSQPAENVPPLACGCPGSTAKAIKRAGTANPHTALPAVSELQQWPCQLQLVPAGAAYFDNAHLLVTADCAAYAYANMHADFMRNKITVIGCPKLDHADYAAKLTQILQLHEIKSVTVVRMEVPCCGGLVNAVKEALTASGKMIPWQVAIIGTDGTVREA
jgi:NAD-dependent dihydropyrimidine dehydrogenase PreA subunit